MKQMMINPILRQLHRRVDHKGWMASAVAGSRLLSSRGTPPPAKSLVLQDNTKKVLSPWKQKADPQGSQLTYFWNTETNETTALGSTKPFHWVEVRDPAGSSLTYWWNIDNNQTTALGAPRPGMYDSTALVIPQQQATPFGYMNQQGPPQTLGQSMKMYFAMGIGMSLAIGAVRALLG